MSQLFPGLETDPRYPIIHIRILSDTDECPEG